MLEQLLLAQPALLGEAHAALGLAQLLLRAAAAGRGRARSRARALDAPVVRLAAELGLPVERRRRGLDAPDGLMRAEAPSFINIICSTFFLSLIRYSQLHTF